MTLYRVPMLSTTEVSILLAITSRRARQLVSAHKKAVNDGTRWLLPVASLDDLRTRNTKRGRPKKSRLTAT